MRFAICCLVVSVFTPVLASDASQPHYHTGKLVPYEIGPPSILLSHGDEDRLQAGETLMQAIVNEDGVSRRLVMVKDVQAPPDIITQTILDIDAYPRMIKGCDSTSTYEYSESQETGLKTIRTKYEISVSCQPLTNGPCPC